MIGKWLDSLVGVLAPQAGLRRMQARRVMRSYAGAEANRLTNNRKPRNLSADNELLGPFGADALRAWGRELVRNNAYAWGVVDTIVSSVVGLGINAQSMVETPDGDDVETVNDARDKIWSEWCEVCDINGQYTFSELQMMAQREMCEAGEVIIHLVKLPSTTYRGIYRPVPLALELVEADRIAADRDTYQAGRQTENRIIRGVEMDELGKPVAYWIYPEHPNSPYINKNQTPTRIDAKNIIHLFRRDRVGQSRGVTWFAPVMSWLRDLGVYVDNEIQASAVASCFGVAIKTNGSVPGLMPGDGAESQDSNGNTFEYLEPAMVVRLNPGESVESINPGRPNSASEPWISLMLRGIAVGTGLSYEIVARDYSKTSYSSSRTSQLEDRRRFRRWQRYLVHHLCQPVWDRFCEQAALAGVEAFPTMADLLEDRRSVAPVEWQTTEWEWVDPQSEQTASTMAIDNFQSTLQAELGQRGKNWRAVLYQRAKEQKLKQELGLITPSEAQSVAMVGSAGGETAATSAGPDLQAEALNGAQVTSLVGVITQVGTGAMPKDTAKAIVAAAFPLISVDVVNQIIDPIEPGSIAADGVPVAVAEPDASSQATPGVYMGLSTQQWNRNRKAIQKTLDELASGTMSEAAARVFLASVGMPQEHIDILIKDALDGSVDAQLPAEEAANV